MVDTTYRKINQRIDDLHARLHELERVAKVETTLSYKPFGDYTISATVRCHKFNTHRLYALWLTARVLPL